MGTKVISDTHTRTHTQTSIHILGGKYGNISMYHYTVFIVHISVLVRFIVSARSLNFKCIFMLG